MTTKSCDFLPKREFLLGILHCSIEFAIFRNHNFYFAYRKLKWNIMRRAVLFLLLLLFNRRPFSSVGSGGGGGDRGRDPGRSLGERGTEGGRRKGGKRDSQSGGNREKRRKFSQHCVTFYKRNRTKRQEPLRKGAGSGNKSYGRREFQTPLSPPTW